MTIHQGSYAYGAALGIACGFFFGMAFEQMNPKPDYVLPYSPVYTDTGPWVIENSGGTIGYITKDPGKGIVLFQPCYGEPVMVEPSELAPAKWSCNEEPKRRER